MRSPLVLIVDDCGDNTDSLGIYFQACHHAVLWVYSATAAQLAACEYNFDAMIIDIKMPYEDGWDLVRFLKTANPKTLFIAFSGCSMPHEVEQSYVAGFDVHITKPDDPRHLVHLVEKHVTMLEHDANKQNIKVAP